MSDRSYIKIGLIVDLHLLFGIADHILGVEYDVVLLLQIRIEKIELLLVVVIVDAEEGVPHRQGHVVVLLYRHRGLLLHRAFSHALPRRPAHEAVVHLLLFFSSVLHRLQVTRKGRRAPPARPPERHRLDLRRREVVQLLHLHPQIRRQVVLLLILPEGVWDDRLLLF